MAAEPSSTINWVLHHVSADSQISIVMWKFLREYSQDQHLGKERERKGEPGLIRGSWVVLRIFSNNLMESSETGITPHCNKGTWFYVLVLLVTGSRSCPGKDVEPGVRSCASAETISGERWRLSCQPWWSPEDQILQSWRNTCGALHSV